MDTVTSKIYFCISFISWSNYLFTFYSPRLTVMVCLHACEINSDSHHGYATWKTLKHGNMTFESTGDNH